MGTQTIVLVLWVIIWLICFMLIEGQLYSVVVLIAVARKVTVWLRGRLPWAWREFGDPLLCMLCTYVGVLSASTCPLAMLAYIYPSAVIGVALSPLAAWIVATLVFDCRAYQRWQNGRRHRLGVRLLRSYSDGLLWPYWLVPTSVPRLALTG